MHILVLKGRFTGLFLLSISLLLTACASQKKPARIIHLPPELSEASGLSIQDAQEFYLHNDSGDDPILYRFNPATSFTEPIRIPARALDWEDMSRDSAGHFYLGDIGNNRGHRKQQTIYRYAPSGQTDSIVYTYPGQDGGGRSQPGNYNCEAMIYHQGQLHLFTKAKAGVRKKYWAYHFKVPAQPGKYEAQLLDSLYLPRRVITAAALDEERKTLVLTAYNYKRLFGFFPVAASSLITLSDYPGDRFLQGKMRRRNLSWAIPTQYEAVDFYNDRYLYIATERTIMKRQGLRRIKRKD